MYTEYELNNEILIITMLIQKRYPELSKYLEEMQVTIPNIAHPRITKTNLLDYYDSLVSLFTDYGATHCGVIA